MGAKPPSRIFPQALDTVHGRGAALTGTLSRRPLPMIEPEPPADLEPPSSGDGRPPQPSRPGSGLRDAIRDLIGGIVGN